MTRKQVIATAMLFAAYPFVVQAQTPLGTYNSGMQGRAAGEPGGISGSSKTGTPAADIAGAHTLYVKVHVRGPVKLNKLKTGQTVLGTLAEPVYSGTTELFPAGSAISMRVQGTRKRRRPANDHWPWVVRAFTPRHETYPVFGSGEIRASANRRIPLRLTLISIDRERHVRMAIPRKKQHGRGSSPAKGGQHNSTADASTGDRKPMQHEGIAKRDTAKQKGSSAELTFTFEATLPDNGVRGNSVSANSLSPAEISDRAAGEHARIVLLDSLMASKAHPGDKFEARVIAPVMSQGAVLIPEGTLVKGHIAKVVPPRWLSRSGSLLLDFDALTLPGAAPASVSASTVEADLDQRSHTKIDSEGMLHGAHPGKLWTLINLGTTGGIAKASDDGLQLVIEAVVSTATDASTAGTGRIAASCASAIFMITRHGRDVVLPKYTEMEIAFNRSVSVPLPNAKSVSSSADAAQRAESADSVLP